MAKPNVNDLLALGILLISILLFYLSWSQESLLIKFTGLTGSTILIIVETVFLFKSWVK